MGTSKDLTRRRRELFYLAGDLDGDDECGKIQDRLSFMRLLSLVLGDKVHDAKAIRPFRQHLTQASAVENLFARLDKHLSKAGYLAMGDQIIDATIVATQKP